MRLFAARDRYRPNRNVITFFLLVNGHSHKRHALSVRRNLRITDPDKIEKILLGDVTLLRKKIPEAKNDSEYGDKKITHGHILWKQCGNWLVRRGSASPLIFVHRRQILVGTIPIDIATPLQPFGVCKACTSWRSLGRTVRFHLSSDSLNSRSKSKASVLRLRKSFKVRLY